MTIYCLKSATFPVPALPTLAASLKQPPLQTNPNSATPDRKSEDSSLKNWVVSEENKVYRQWHLGMPPTKKASSLPDLPTMRMIHQQALPIYTVSSQYISSSLLNRNRWAGSPHIKENTHIWKNEPKTNGSEGRKDQETKRLCLEWMETERKYTQIIENTVVIK